MEPCAKNNPKEDKVFLEISTKKVTREASVFGSKGKSLEPTIIPIPIVYFPITSTREQTTCDYQKALSFFMLAN